MELTKLGTIKFPNQFGYGGFPWALDGRRAFVRGHNQSNDLAEVQLPEIGGTATVTRWCDPTHGRLAALTAENKANGSASQGMFHRGLMCAGDALYGFVQPYYNVSNAWLKSFWRADASTFAGWGKTSIPSLITAGFLGVLPPSLQAATGKDTWCFESVAQGLAVTNNGPALYIFNRDEPLADGSTVSMSALLESPFNRPYDSFWGDRGFAGACFTKTHFVCGYSKSFGARWYGTQGWGRLYAERGTQVPQHPIYSESDPTKLAVDPRIGAPGYHAEQFAPFLLCASIESILAGQPVWEEINLRPFGLAAKWCMVAPQFDPVTDQLQLMEYRADGDRPLLHVFQTQPQEDPQMIQELQATITTLTQQANMLEAEITAKNATIDTLTNERNAAEQRATASELKLIALNNRIDAAQAAE